MKLTRFAAALGLAAAAVPAFAAIGTIDEQTELFGVVWDESFGSYALDLGVTLNDFRAAANTPGYSFSRSVGAAYQKFTAADKDPNDGTQFTGTRWAIFAADVQSFGDAGEADGYRYLTTSFGTDKPRIDNSQLQAGTGTVSLKATEISATGTHNIADVAQNGESFNPKGESGFFDESQNSFSNAGTWAGNKPNTSSKVYYFFTSSGDPTVDSTRVDFGGNANFNGTAFSYAVAAIPEPSTYALLLAGLLTVGFVARRRG